jgi:hypothetical protein
VWIEAGTPKGAVCEKGHGLLAREVILMLAQMQRKQKAGRSQKRKATFNGNALFWGACALTYDGCQE